MKNDLSIRMLMPDDWQLLGRLCVRAVAQNPGAHNTTPRDLMQLSRSYWQDRCHLPGYAQSYTLEESGKIVGCASVGGDEHDPTGMTAKLFGSYVPEEHRRQGYGSLLYRARLGWARANHFDGVVLECYESNKASQKLAEHWGFECSHTVPHFRADGSREQILRFHCNLEEISALLNALDNTEPLVIQTSQSARKSGIKRLIELMPWTP